MTAGAVLLAAALDAVLREPPTATHPVRAIGGYLEWAGRRVPPAPAARAVVSGAAAWTVGAVAAAGIGRLIERSAADRRHAVTPIVGVALWPLFSFRMLLDEVAAVEVALAGGVEAGREAVSRIVGRDVATLTEDQVRQAALESLAENLSDSVVAPLLWYAVGGLPAAALYRFANTADACWGYRTPRWRHAGRVAARADDLLNLLPARLTGLALAGSRVRPRVLRREARRTPSPNAGWPMAAMALRLGVRLEKPGVYTLNPAGRPTTPADTERALRLARRCGVAAIGAAALLAGIRARRRRT